LKTFCDERTEKPRRTQSAAGALFFVIFNQKNKFPPLQRTADLFAFNIKLCRITKIYLYRGGGCFIATAPRPRFSVYFKTL